MVSLFNKGDIEFCFHRAFDRPLEEIADDATKAAIREAVLQAAPIFIKYLERYYTVHPEVPTTDDPVLVVNRDEKSGNIRHIVAYYGDDDERGPSRKFASRFKKTRGLLQPNTALAIIEFLLRDENINRYFTLDQLAENLGTLTFGMLEGYPIFAKQYDPEGTKRTEPVHSRQNIRQAITSFRRNFPAIKHHNGAYSLRARQVIWE